MTYTSPTSITLDLDTVGAAAGPQKITVTNPDGQAAESFEAIRDLRQRERALGHRHRADLGAGDGQRRRRS